MNDRKSLIREIYQINFQRLKTAIIVLIPFHLILIAIDLQRLFSGVLAEHLGYRYLYYLHLFMLLMLAVYLFLFTRHKEFNFKTVNKTHRKLLVSFLVFLTMIGAIVSTVDQMIHGGIWAYIIAILAVGVAIYLPIIERLWVFLPAHILFIIGIIVFQDNPDLVWGNLINGSLILVVGMLLSGLLYKTYCKAHEESTKRNQAEEALRSSEQELKTITDNTTDVVAMADIEGKLTYLSESSYRLNGYRPSELLGKSILELIHKEDLSTVGAVFQEGIVEGRKDARVEYRIRNKKGSYIWVETIGSLIIDDNGQPSGALFTSRDISERKQAEEALRSSEEKYRQITDNMSDVVWITDLNLKTIYVSPSIEKVVGESVHVHMNRTLEEKHPPEAINLLISTIQEEIEKEGDLSLDKSRSRVIDVEYLKVDGSIIWLSMHISAVRDSEGSITGFQGVTRDISERKKAELDLIESENKFKTLFQDSLVSIIVFDKDTGEIVDANETAWKSYGLDSLTELQKNDFWMEPPYSAKESLEWIHKTVNEGVQVFEWKNCKVTGEIFWEQVMVRPTIINGIERIISSATDITDRKQAEEALRQSEEKYKKIAENISDVVWTTDAELKTVYMSPSVEKLTGESVDCRMNRSLEERFPPDSLNKLLNTFQEEIEKDKDSLSEKNRSRIIEVQQYKADGSIIWVSMHISAIRDKDGNITGLQGVTRDITERKKAEEQIRYIGFHDQLTDLHNRHYFESCTKELKDIPLLSVIMTDINGLKLINDTYGHKVGDELLKKYAELLRKSFKQSDLIFRWGGDEFIIILKNTKEAKSWELCNRLIKHCGKTYVKGIPLSISVGISSKLEGGDINKAIKEAEDMMYKNKLTESKSNKNLIMKTLLQTLSEKSYETKEHIDRMTLFGRQFGERLSLPPSELSRLETLAMLHDIGKINIDSHILLKKTALNDKEWEEIKKHPEVGYRITRTTEEFAYIAEEILAHHERWDGNGYPQSLGEENIPYLARILNIIDSYDVMSSGRPYKKKMIAEEIVEEIESCSGKQFDPNLAEEFVVCLKEGFIGFE